MSKKRKFGDIEGVDQTLVQLYEELVDDREDFRLKAAHRLISRTLNSTETSNDQVQKTLKRLCRGLCSSRKAARLGFSVALTELISALRKLDATEHNVRISASYLIDVLEAQTIPEGQSSGQDERDHYLGRLFGAGAILSSEIIFQNEELDQWQRLLDVICGIATKKPWLRQECGWILFKSIGSFLSDRKLEPFALTVLDKLNENRLIRTPEGLAIWIAIRNQLPNAKMPKHIWRHGDPFSKQDISLLADVLKDAKAQPTGEEHEFESQGSAMWSPQLHFAWGIVFGELYRMTDQHINGVKDGNESRRIGFETLWAKAVDESLLSSSASVERKHWGLMLLCKMFSEAPRNVWKEFLTKPSIQCLMTSLKGEDGYLQRASKRAIQALQTRLNNEPLLRSDCISGFIEGSGFIDFDNVTKTKVFEKILTPADLSGIASIEHQLFEYLKDPRTPESAEAHRRRKVIINVQSRFFELLISRPTLTYDAQGELDELSTNTPSCILERWVDFSYFEVGRMIKTVPPMKEETRKYMKERLTGCFEYGLKHGAIGMRLLRQAIVHIRRREVDQTSRLIEFDEAVEETVRQAWSRLRKTPTSWRLTESNTWESESESDDYLSDEEELDKLVPPDLQPGTAFDDGLTMLYCLTLFQAYNGEAEAVEILEDLLSYHDRLDSKGKAIEEEDEDGSETLVEILLSFASKPSKFQRRVTLQVFEALAPQITSKGIQSLIRVLATKETTEGQQEMFEAADFDGEVEGDGSQQDSDGENVESVSEAESTVSGSDDLLNSTNGGIDEDEELADFEAKLAQALGTRKGEDDLEAGDTSDSSDSDMGDDQMMELDEKLAEVFRTRQNAPNKRKEQRSAKVTIVHFKNRVLDFIEVYLKHEYLSPQSVELILPLLKLARKTNTKQLADTACKILRDFCSRCKGQNVPALRIKEEESLDEAVQILRDIHLEAGLEGSNARAAACSSASILLVKTLLNGSAEMQLIVDVYGDTRVRQLTDKKCKVQPAFFTEWNNWCAQARNQLAK